MNSSKTTLKTMVNRQQMFEMLELPIALQKVYLAHNVQKQPLDTVMQFTLCDLVEVMQQFNMLKKSKELVQKVLDHSVICGGRVEQVAENPSWEGRA